ncbi:MAG: hypothetical protein WBQ19_04775 [Terriglobales bacterium]
MTAKEHKLMIAMFTRINERVGIIANTLTSRGIWSGDDAQAFAHAVHFDQEKLKTFALQALDDYHIFAAQIGVDTKI